MGDALLLGLDPNQRIDPRTGKAFVAQEQPQRPSVQHASLAGPGPSFSTPKPSEEHPDDRQGMMSTARSDGAPRHPQAVRQLTPDELLAQANEMLDNQRAQTQAMGATQSTGARDDSGGKIPDWLAGYMEHQ